MQEMPKSMVITSAARFRSRCWHDWEFPIRARRKTPGWQCGDRPVWQLDLILCVLCGMRISNAFVQKDGFVEFRIAGILNFRARAEMI